MENKHTGFLAESDGSGQSSMRLIMMLVVLFIMLGWLIVAVYSAIRSTGTYTLPDMPINLVYLITVMIFGKVVQKSFELNPQLLTQLVAIVFRVQLPSNGGNDANKSQ